MRRGEVWVANLNPPRGREIGKIRPVLIMQAPELHWKVTPMIVVLPMTTQVIPGLKRWRIHLSARDRLKRDCQVITDQPHALDRGGIADGPLTVLTEEEMSAVEGGLRAALGML